MKYVAGLDNGGTVIKAALFSLDGRQVGKASRSTDLITPQPGWTERDMDVMWAQNAACLKEVIATTGVKPEEIAGVAVCGHGKGLYPWGKDGKPAYNGIISTDNRAWREVDKWKADGTHESQYEKLCQQLMPCQPLPILAWFKEHNRKVYDNIKYAFSCYDYIRFMLTGEANIEATAGSGSALMNVRDANYDKDMLKAFGLEEAYDMLPPLRYSSDLCGKVTKKAAEETGLLEGTPVAGGLFDIDGCAIAMSVLEQFDMCTITGTWTINEFISKKPYLKTAIAMNSLYAIPGFYLIEESSSTGAGCLEWVIDNVFPPNSSYKELDTLVASLAPEKSDVYFLPFLQGSNRHPLAKASWVGLTSFHSRADMLRSVYEGAAYSAKQHIDKLLSVRDRPKALRMAGGAANSPLWVQMFADILNLPIETVTGVSELGALGAAMSSAVAAGLFKDYHEACTAMVRIGKAVEPDKSKVGIYADKYAKYDAVCGALDTIWDKFEV
ncbi:MAG: carbohydrate kinase [Spirochaetaceae bacterium]|jgi:L-xylulokinase|nr:carbohydrate kinase [Spirochaetaceae bacterium]